MDRLPCTTDNELIRSTRDSLPAHLMNSFKAGVLALWKPIFQLSGLYMMRKLALN